MTGIKNHKKRGSALLLTMLILFGIIAVTFGGAALILAGLRNSDLSSKSTVAYYNAESGAEKLLYETRKTGRFSLSTIISSTTPIFSNNTNDNGGTFYINYDQQAGFSNGQITTFTMIGTFQGIKRSVQINF